MNDLNIEQLKAEYSVLLEFDPCATFSSLNEFLNRISGATMSQPEIRALGSGVCEKYALFFLEQRQLDDCIKTVMYGRHFATDVDAVGTLELYAIEAFLRKGERINGLQKLKVLSRKAEQLSPTNRERLRSLREQALSGALDAE